MASPARTRKNVDRSPYHHGNLREALVEASVGILAEEGLEGLGLRSAARAAGVSAAAPYHHFGGKEGLLAAVAAEGFRRLGARQREIQRQDTSGASAIARVSALGRSYIQFARENPELYRLMFGRGIENREAYPELLEALESSYAVIEAACTDIVLSLPESNLSAKVAINGAWSVVHGLASLLNDGKVRPGELGNPDEEALIDSILEIWARGIAQGLQGWQPER